MRRSAILLVEARGQSIHCREDACVNLAQAAVIAKRLLEAGVETRVRLIVDAGQSIEEYSLLCHQKQDAAAFRERIAGGDARQARYAIVRELRERYLPLALAASGACGIEIEERLPYSPLLARVAGANEDALRNVDHPLFARERTGQYLDLVRAHAGGLWLDFDLAVARAALRELLGSGFDDLDLATVSRPDDAPHRWLAADAALIASDLAEKERGGGHAMGDRLIGLFLSVTPAGEERPYFNSPTCVRVEHGKVRVIARDRFDIFDLKSSERMKFDDLRALLAAQAAGAPRRLAAIKYPHTARLIASGIAGEARELAANGPVKVFFIDGVGGWNPATSGLLDALLRSELPPEVAFHRIVGNDEMYRTLPDAPGGILFVLDAVRRMERALFEPELDQRALTVFTAASDSPMQPAASTA